jgi:hypothetical protein
MRTFAFLRESEMSLKLAAAVVVSLALGFGYTPVAAFIARSIAHLAQVVGGG